MVAASVKGKVKPNIVGYANGNPILSGEWVFFIMDSTGMPLDFILDMLREQDTGFDVIGFLRAAIQSGNFTLEKAVKRLKIPYEEQQIDLPREMEETFDWLLGHPNFV